MSLYTFHHDSFEMVAASEKVYICACFSRDVETDQSSLDVSEVVGVTSDRSANVLTCKPEIRVEKAKTKSPSRMDSSAHGHC